MNLHIKLYSTKAFVNKFSENMQSGRNLEEIFLETRRDYSSTDFPMISTTQGKQVQEKLYSLISPYLYSQNKLYEYLEENSSSFGVCKHESQYKELSSLIQFMSKLDSAINFNDKRLLQLLQEYKNDQASYMKRINGMDLNKLNNVETFSSESKTWMELIRTDFESIINEKSKDLKKSKNKEERLKITENINLYHKLNSSKQEIMASNPELVVMQKAVDDFWGNNKIIMSSLDIANESRILYNNYYRYLNENKAKNEANPCRDFVL